MNDLLCSSSSLDDEMRSIKEIEANTSCKYADDIGSTCFAVSATVYESKRKRERALPKRVKRERGRTQYRSTKNFIRVTTREMCAACVYV
jgi:hypothetical protein